VQGAVLVFRLLETRLAGADMFMGAADDLAAGGLRLAEDAGDLAILRVEGLAQDEGGALFRPELFQHHHQRQ